MAAFRPQRTLSALWPLVIKTRSDFTRPRPANQFTKPAIVVHHLGTALCGERMRRKADMEFFTSYISREERLSRKDECFIANDDYPSGKYYAIGQDMKEIKGSCAVGCFCQRMADDDYPAPICSAIVRKCD